MSFRALLPSNHKQIQHSHTFTLSRHVLYVFTLVSCLIFTSLMQPLLLSQHFLLWCSFTEQQCLQEASVRLLLLFLGHSNLLCWGFASLAHLVLPCSVFYIFTLFCIYTCFQQHFFAALCSGDSSLITYQLLCQILFCWLNCSGLQCILQCNVMCCSALQCNLQSFHCSLLTFLIFLFYSVSGHSLYIQIPVLNI